MVRHVRSPEARSNSARILPWTVRLAYIAAVVTTGCNADRVHTTGDAAADDGGVDAPMVVNDGYDWGLAPGVPRPVAPADNPMTAAKVELGRHLFYDTRLSGNGTFSCASCHEQAKAFTDGRATSVGSTGEMHRRSAMSLANVAYANTLTWANPLITTLEHQALIPMFGETPVELGLAGQEDALRARLEAVPTYEGLFADAFPSDRGDDPITLDHLTKALAAFQRSLLSFGSPYDRYAYHDERNAISAAAKRGDALFHSERLECFHCHGSFNFSDSVNHEGTVFQEISFHNTGLYNVDGQGGYPAADTGLHEITDKNLDMGRFKAPTLRNIEVTAPYMHDGSIATLDEAIDHYAAGGRTIASGPNTGVGSASPLRSEFVRGFELTASEREDLKAFLRSLTDTEFLGNPAHSNPWPVEP